MFTLRRFLVFLLDLLLIIESYALAQLLNNDFDFAFAANRRGNAWHLSNLLLDGVPGRIPQLGERIQHHGSDSLPGAVGQRHRTKRRAQQVLIVDRFAGSYSPGIEI